MVGVESADGGLLLGRPIFFMHIAKTAGTSINASFQRHLGERALDHAEGDRLGWKGRVGDFDFISGHVRLSEFEAAWPASAFKFTVVREPIGHLMSHLNWMTILRQQERFIPFLASNPDIAKITDDLQGVDQSDPFCIRRYLDITPEVWPFFDNCQSRYFAASSGKYAIADFKKAVDTYEQFDFVGLSDDLGIAIETLSARLGFPLDVPEENVEDYQKDIDRGAFRKTLAPYVSFDCALWDLANC